MELNIYEVFHPIYGIKIDTPTPVTIGIFTFYQFPRDRIAALEKCFNNPGEAEANIWFREYDKEPAVISVQIQAEDAKSAEGKANILFARLLYLFGFQIFGIHEYCQISFEKPSITTSEYVVMPKSGQQDGLQHFNVLGKYRMICLSNFLELEQSCFSNIIEKLSMVKPSKMEQRLLHAIDFCGLATRTLGQPSSFVQAITTLECLLSMDTDYVTQHVSENYALIFEKDCQKRIEARNKIKKLYNIRSRLVHGDTSDISKYDCEEVIQIAQNVIISFLTDPKLVALKSENDFKKYIDMLKFEAKEDENNA